MLPFLTHSHPYWKRGLWSRGLCLYWLWMMCGLWLTILGVSSELWAKTYQIQASDLRGTNLAPAIEIYLDKSRELTLDDLKAQREIGFKPIPSGKHSVGIFAGYVWLRLHLQQNFAETQSVVLDLNQQARKMDLFVKAEGEEVIRFSETGYLQKQLAPFQLPSLGSSWELELPRAQTQEIYIRIDADQAYTVQMTLYDLRSFYLKERTSLFFGGLYFGIMLLLVAMNIVQFFQSRELSYLLYVLTLSLLHIPVIGATLYGTEFLGFRLTFAEGRHLILFKMLGVLSMTLFSRSILVSSENRRIDRIYLLLAALHIPFILGWFVIRPLANWHAMFNNLILLSMVFTLFVAVYRMGSGYRPAIIFGVSILPICVVSISAIVLQLLKMPHLMPDLGIIFPSCLIFQVVALSYAVIDKVRMLQLQKEREAALYQEEILQLNSSLENKVEEQTQEIRTMLDHTHLGLLSIGTQLSIHKDYSKHLEHLLETDQIGGSNLWNVLLSRVEAGSDKQDMYRCALEYSIGEEAMFFEANAAMLPQQIKVKVSSGAKIFDCDWSPILDKEGRVERVLLGLSDVTEKLTWEKKAEEDRLRLQCLAEILSRGTVSFYKLESELKSICQDMSHLTHEDRSSCRSLYVRLHTLKSRSRIANYQAMTSMIHELEENLVSEKPQHKIDPSEIAQDLQKTEFVLDLYHQALHSIEKFKRDSEVQQKDQFALASLLKDFESVLHSLCLELDKVPCELQVHVPEGLVLSPQEHEALYGALLHILRNTADHGLENPGERAAQGKPSKACLSADIDPRGYLVLADDGRGLALQKIAEKARERGLDYSDSQSLANLIFESGFSTKSAADQISGRGVGMDAVRMLLRQIGGDAWIELKGEPNAMGYVSFVTVLHIPLKNLSLNQAVA